MVYYSRELERRDRIWQKEDQMTLDELKELIANDVGEMVEVKESTVQRSEMVQTNVV